MKALFIHDHPFIRNKDTNVLYTSGNLNSVLWNRYLKHFDELTVIGRLKIEDDTSRFNRAEADKVTFNLFNDVCGGADYFKKRKKIEKKLKKEINQHYVVIMRFPATISIFAAQYCNKNNIPYVAEVVGCSWDGNWNYGGLAPKIVAPYSFFQMKKAVKNASAAIYVTKDFLQKRYPSNTEIKANASNVILNEVDDSILSTRISKISQMKMDGFHLGIIGNLSVKYKGYDVLLKAVDKLPNPLKKQITISFVGGGDQTYLRSLINSYGLHNQTVIVGKLKSGAEIFNFIDTLDLYVHPSKQEGLPRVVIEAMSRACPVLASSVAGTPELISKSCIHKPGDSIKLSNDISNLLLDKEELKQLAKINIESSKNYLFKNLEKVREDFFKKYIEKFKK